jgi:hypothetical protein
MTMARVEKVSKIKRRSIKPLGAKSSSPVEGASEIIEIGRIICMMVLLIFQLDKGKQIILQQRQQSRSMYIDSPNNPDVQFNKFSDSPCFVNST